MDTDNDSTTTATANDTDQVAGLREVREKAIKALGELFSQAEGGTPEERFDSALNLLKYGSDAAIANSALESALAVEDSQVKSELLTQLIDEVSYLEDSLKS